MDLWSLILLLSSFIIFPVTYLLLFNRRKGKLPPGPLAIPFLGNFFLLYRSFGDIEQILIQDLFKRHGPIVTLHIGSRPNIFIADRAIAHKALVELGSTFADRPPPDPATKLLSCNQHDVSSSSYGSLWRLLRRNLMSKILHTSRINIYSAGRDWALGMLMEDLRAQSRSSSNDGSVVVKDSLQFAMFRLLVLMCFGEKLDEKAIREIEAAQRDLLVYIQYLSIFDVFPAISKYIFFSRWRTAMEMRKKQKELYLPLIKTRREYKKGQLQDGNKEERFAYSYLDSLLDIKLPEEGGRDLTEDEMVNICAEFLDAGTDTTSNALQWVMAELVRHPEVQKKLVDEIERVVAEKNDGTVKEEEIEKMPYLKAVIMEGLRRHPPGHFLLPHTVTQEVELEGYVIPKDASVNVMLAVMGQDEKVWDEPMEFRPERFLAGGEGEGVDITGSRGIRMMPFGVGRRMCPGYGLAMLHLEYFVANLVREFEWKEVEGVVVDLSEKMEFTVEMKYPLRARLIPRRTC